MDAVRQHGARLLPVDSEHNAIFQCMPPEPDGGMKDAGVTRIMLTASGGPFRTRPVQALRDVTAAEACAHPNWDMGRKISVDSATMMNKGLEVIEACWLFDTGAGNIEVVIPSREYCAFPGRVFRRLGAGATGEPGYAHAHSPCHGLAGADGNREWQN